MFHHNIDNNMITTQTKNMPSSHINTHSSFRRSIPPAMDSLNGCAYKCPGLCTPIQTHSPFRVPSTVCEI